MSAQNWAKFCLLNLVVCAVWGASNGPPGAELVVYLSADPGQSPHLLDAMKRELGQIMQTAGYDLTWRDASAVPLPATDAPLLVVHLTGVCALSSDPPRALPTRPASLGSTAIAHGQVLPFSSVDCASLARLLAPLLAPEPLARRDFLLGRAAARVLAHEFYHVLTGERGHASSGVAKPVFSPVDLVAERFVFTPSTLARLQPKRPAGASADAADESATGRN